VSRGSAITAPRGALSAIARAKIAGTATIRREPQDFEYGERQYEAEDLAGHRWIFSETLRDARPEEWGGTTAGDPW
jgi:uncharacterized glyoxalase superfamily protein PhnB